MSSPQIIIDGLAFTECPRWHDGTIWVNDMHDDRVIQMDESGKVLQNLEVPGRPGGVGWLPDGSLVVTSTIERKVYRFVEGKREFYADLSNIGVTEHEINDMVVDAEGRCFIGEFGFDVHEWLHENAELIAQEGLGSPNLKLTEASVLCVDVDKSVTIAASGFKFPNGGSIHPVTGEYLVGETFGGCFSVFTKDGAKLSDRKIIDLGFAPDGNSRFDAEGATWFSSPQEQAVHRVTPDGKTVDTITFELGVFACELGGHDGKTLFVCVAPTSDPAITVVERRGGLVAVRVDVPVAPEYGA